ncbi:hypothetical protein AN639_01785 [Candidatus Epulonipiscium fishelsonii]|uniref:Uncharacterized protein n=1 Tax=Candidatus Epulonipiscium fishelsonii TaxID=77094 RepID=A0ACC8XE45_9FIRM|nr:hypothetical protein AN639_01785 [Epulopiscium sp. SCG-B05WGA-EpuloA1]ONI41233.1 hypothetical protein AN396_03865 [Epulopiscium sp. SCG-B11WGA-EpuloA1]
MELIKRGLKFGINSLTDEELLNIIVKTANKKDNIEHLLHVLLQDVNNEINITNLKKWNLKKLNVLGVNEEISVKILSLLELSNRLNVRQTTKKIQVTHPSIVANLLMEDLRYEKQEHFYVVLLDSKCQIILIHCVSKGLLNATIVHPREVYKPAIDNLAHSIIVVHNHPSGNPEPSEEDKEITTRIIKSGEILGIPLRDHIIIGDGEFINLRSIMNF